MVFRTLKSNNGKSHCTASSSTHSPIILPKQEHCVACSLGCDIKFDYMRANDWSISIVRVIDDTFQTSEAPAERKSILRYYVNNYGAHPSKDITFNNDHYQLEFIEFYLPAIHRMPKDTDDSNTSNNPPSTETELHDLEMVMCHRLVGTSSQTTRWVNVSVFVKSQDSYSLTNTFFQQLINTVLVSCTVKQENTENCENVYNSSHLSDDSTFYIPNISWTKPVSNNGSQQTVKRNGRTNGSPAVRLDVGSNWTPYHALPTNKAFYSYLGEFVYAPCKFEASDKVTWVIMNQPVSMHNSEFRVLQRVIGSSTIHNFDYNNGNNYPSVPVATGRNIMYNNGDMVVGNQDQDKFIIKCEKLNKGDKRQSNQPNRLYDSQLDEVRMMQDHENTARSKTSLYTTFQPPVSTMLTIVSCILISTLLFIIFASSNWIHQKAGEMTDKQEHVQYGISIFITIALFVLCALSFVLASSVVVGFQPFGMLIWTGVLLFWTSYPMKFLMRKSNDLYFDGMKYKMVLSWIIYIVTILIWLGIIKMGFITAFAPNFFLNGFAQSLYTYYFTTGYGNNETFYIGKRAVMIMNFAGYRLNYYQENTPIFDDNCMVLPDEFIGLYGHLRIEIILSITGEEKPRKYEKSKENNPDYTDMFVVALEKRPLLEKYDLLMKQDNSVPLHNLVEAVQATLLANKKAERMMNEQKKEWWYVQKKKDEYSMSANYKLDNVDAFKASLKSKNPKLHAFLSSPTVI